METELFLVHVGMEDLAVSTGSQRMVLERTNCLLPSQTGVFLHRLFPVMEKP